MSRRQMMLAAARRPAPAAPPAVNVGPIDFTVAQGYADVLEVIDHPEWVGQTIFSGASGPTVEDAAAHFDQIPREHADMAGKGTRILRHQTTVTDNHVVSALVNTDTMSSADSGQTAVMLVVRGQGTGPESGYMGRIRRINDGVNPLETRFQLHRIDAGVPVLLYESPATVDLTYSQFDNHVLEVEALNNIVSIRCNTNLIVAHDIAGDATQYSTGAHWGWGMEREYEGTGSNTQVVSVDVTAASL